MSQIYQVTLVNFRRSNENGGQKLCIRLEIEGGKKVYHYTPVILPNTENIWIDWTEKNSFNQPKLKVSAGDKLNFNGEIEDHTSIWGGYKVLIGDVINV